MSIAAEIEHIERVAIRETRDIAAKSLESWVTNPEGLGVLFTRRAYTIYGLARREKDQAPYVHSGDLRSRAMRPGRVRAWGNSKWVVDWRADSRILNFMTGKKAIYRQQFEEVGQVEIKRLDKVIQINMDKAP